jgi:hypothetical protein
MNPLNNPNYIRTKNLHLQKLDIMSRRHMGCLRFGENEKEDHIMAKLQSILLEKANGPCEFLTEVYSSDRKFRADIIMFKPLSSGCYAEVIEIAKHETQLSLDNKRAFWEGKCGFGFLIL